MKVIVANEIIGTVTRHTEGWAWITETGDWGFARTPEQARIMILSTLDDFFLNQ